MGVQPGEGDKGGHLSHPVHLPEPHVRRLLLEKVKQGLANGSGPTKDSGDGGEVVGGDGWMGGKEADEGRDQVEELGSVSNQSGEKSCRIETGQDDHLAPVPQHVAHRAVERGDVEHREDHHSGALVLHELDGRVVHLGHAGHQVPVGEHHPLGHPRGAGAVGQPAGGGVW